MDRRRGSLGEGLTHLIESLTRGSEIAAEPLGPEGWLRIEAELGFAGAGPWYQISLDFSVTTELAQPGHTDLYLHPFTLTLGCGGIRAGEWSDALSRHWEALPSQCVANHRRGQGAETLRVQGRLALLDVHAASAEILDLHLRLAWSDRDKREGFEASSRLDRAVLRLSTLGRAGRLLRPPGLESVMVDSAKRF